MPHQVPLQSSASHSHSCPSPGSILVSGALPQCPYPTIVWFAPGVGLASGLGSGSALPSGRSRPQSQHQFQLQYQSQFPRQSLRSLRDSGDTRHGWDPGPLHQCHRGDPRGPSPPSGPVLSDRVSHRHPGPSHYHQQQRRPHRHSYRLGNVRLHRREFHGESYYDVPALMADPRFRDSMRLIEHYSLLLFMTPRQFYYPRVVLQFYHSMTSRGAPSPLELRFSIDDRPGVLRAADISAALGLQTV